VPDRHAEGHPVRDYRPPAATQSPVGRGHRLGGGFAWGTCVHRHLATPWEHAAVDTDWWARGIAIVAALVALGTLGWNIYTWKRQGPVLKVRATCNGRGTAMAISANVFNAGRFDSFIAGATLQWAASAEGMNTPKTFSCDVPAEYVPGLDTFQRPLQAQTGFEFTIVNLRELDPSLDLALHEGRSAKLIVRTATGAKASGKIKYK
jgi:hypothetical protein